MRPRIICHMLASLDGRIDCSILDGLSGEDDYEVSGAQLKGDAWLCGRTTMQLHFADREPFVSATGKPPGPQPVYVARHANSYAISVDTTGKLQWSAGDIDGSHLICIVSKQATDDYLWMLRNKGISYIVAGSKSVDLTQAMDLLGNFFGVRRLLLEGGGHINGAFLDAGLIDEVSLLLAPSIDGRHGIPTVFDGICEHKKVAVALTLKSVETCASKTLWIRYDVVRRNIVEGTRQAESLPTSKNS